MNAERNKKYAVKINTKTSISTRHVVLPLSKISSNFLSKNVKPI